MRTCLTRHRTYLLVVDAIMRSVSDSDMDFIASENDNMEGGEANTCWNVSAAVI